MDTQQLWTTVLSEIELSVTKPIFATFFSHSQIVSRKDAVIVIGCNSTVAASMMETRYYSLLKKFLDKHTKENNSLVFTVVSFKPAIEKDPGPLFSQPQMNMDLPRKSHLRLDFVFDTYAVSSTNQMAYAAATAVADTPGTSYNPLFLYGGVGVGKTHLMQAIGNKIFQKNPAAKIIYCAGEEFTNEIIEAIQTKTTKRFKDKYRSAEVLLIDDVQFLEGKIKVQEEFFHTFNAVQREGGQVVLTSDRPPHEIDRLEERLQSRFEGGLLVDMQNPDFELRCAILRIKAQQKGLDLPVPIAQILAATTDSVRRLEGLLTRLYTEARVKNVPVDESLAQHIVGGPQITPIPAQQVITPKAVAEAVTRRYGVNMNQLKGPRRSRPLARPRQVLMFLLRTELRLPLEEVGLWVGGRDHTTVMHAVDTISTMLLSNDRIREDVLWIKKEVFG